MKTIAQVVEEYRNRQKPPQYKSIKVHASGDLIQEYYDVSNIGITYAPDGIWLEFDCVMMHSVTDATHVKLHGHVIEYVNSIVE